MITLSEKKPMTVADAGRKGGRRVAERYGHEHYRRIGRKGGRRTAELVAAGKKALEE